MKNIKGPIVIAEEDQAEVVRSMPTEATHVVNLSPDFEDEEHAAAVVKEKEKRDAEEAEVAGRQGLVAGFVVRKSTKCQTTSAVFVEPKPKAATRARPKLLTTWLLNAFGRKGVADAALAAAATSTVPFAFDTIPDGW